jgi:hypothetical protein
MASQPISGTRQHLRHRITKGAASKAASQPARPLFEAVQVGNRYRRSNGG